MMNDKPLQILITGDAGPDYDFYLPSTDRNPSPEAGPAKIRCNLGGSGLCYRLLEHWTTLNQERNITVAFHPPEKPTSPTFAIWEPQKCALFDKGKPQTVWRASQTINPYEVDAPIGLSEPQYPQAKQIDGNPDLMLIVDNAGSFRHPQETIAAFESSWKDEATSIIWKMTPPICRGDLWWKAVSQNVLSRTTIILTLKDLRSMPVRISKRVSWERTALEIARELDQTPALSNLRMAKNVIVTIEGEGAVWRQQGASENEDARYFLYFDPAHMESEWWQGSGETGDAYGFSNTFASALTAAMATEMCETKAIKKAIPNGLLAMRALNAIGHQSSKEKDPGFPTEALACIFDHGKDGLNELKSKAFGKITSCEIPRNEFRKLNSDWRIVVSENTTSDNQPLFGLARRIAVYGESQLAEIPYAKFKFITTADRFEIEALRNIRTQIDNYKNSKETKPLSIAVFGPPGAGKSFGVKQISKEILGDNVPIKEFNLSQFNEADLAGAFHQIRDICLEGKIPIVFWDEFDSSEFKWLKLLLAPMNDGLFQEGQMTHPIGRCVFVFAGGTSYDFENFGPAAPDASASPEEIKAWEAFKLVKGPDFKSRLHATLNVLGPNRRGELIVDPNGIRKWTPDPTDICFPLRRAILLRAMLGVFGNTRLTIDSGLLSALLETSKFTNGSRSFEKVLKGLKTNRMDSRAPFRPSDLPSDAVLAMNIDNLQTFKSLLNQNDEFKSIAPKLAKAFHDEWREGKRQRMEGKPFNYDCEFDELPQFKKNDNIAAAMRMPQNMDFGGMKLVEKTENLQNVVNEIPEKLVIPMSKEEHYQWMGNMIAEGFRQIRDDEERNDDLLIHDNLLPWEKLSQDVKAYDINFVKNYPVFADMAGYAIVMK